MLHTDIHLREKRRAKKMDRRQNFMKAINFEESERVPVDCSTHCGIMKQKFEELAKHFKIENPEFASDVIIKENE